MAHQLKKTPGELEFSGNIAENWKLWRQKLEIYMRATKAYTEPEEDQVAILLNFIGDEGIKVFNTFSLSEVDR